jgi:hypothetical protein
VRFQRRVGAAWCALAMSGAGTLRCSCEFLVERQALMRRLEAVWCVDRFFVCLR